MKMMLLAALVSRVLAPAVAPDGRALEGDYRGIAVEETIVDVNVGRLAPTMCGPRGAPTVALVVRQGDVDAIAIIDDNASVIRLPAAAISQPVASADCQTFSVVLADGGLARVDRTGDVVHGAFVSAPADVGEWVMGLPFIMAGATCATAAPGGRLARAPCAAPQDGVVLDDLDGQRVVGLLAGEDDDVLALTDVGSVWLASGSTVVKLADGQAAGVAMLPAGDDVLVVRRDGSVTSLSTGRSLSLGAETVLAPVLLQHGSQRLVVAAVGSTVAVVDVDTGARQLHNVASAPMGHLLLGTSFSPWVAVQVSSQESQVIALDGELSAGSMPVSGAVIGDTTIQPARAMSVALRPIAVPADRAGAIDAIADDQQGLSCSSSSGALPSLAFLGVFMVLLLQRRRSAALVIVLLAAGQASAQTAAEAAARAAAVDRTVTGELLTPLDVPTRADGATTSEKRVLLFEDMLGKGQNDWDYNDAVVRTKSETWDCKAGACGAFFEQNAVDLETWRVDLDTARAISSSGAVIRLDVEQVATGAGYVHGLRERLKFVDRWIAWVVHTYADGTLNVEVYEDVGVLDVPLYDTHAVFDAGTYVNTVGSTGFTSPLQNTHLVVFAEGPVAAGIANAPGPWDLYLLLPWLDADGGNEIHRVSISGQTEITAEPATLVDRPLPFVLELKGTDAQWPCEGVPIWHVFPRFVDEVLAGGNPGDVVTDPSPPSLTWSVGGNPTCKADGRIIGAAVTLCDPNLGLPTCGVPGDETTSYAFDFDSDSKVKPDDPTADIMKEKDWLMRNGTVQAPSGFKVTDIDTVVCAIDDGRTYSAEPIPFFALAGEVYCVITADGAVVRLMADEACCGDITIRALHER